MTDFERLANKVNDYYREACSRFDDYARADAIKSAEDAYSSGSTSVSFGRGIRDDAMREAANSAVYTAYHAAIDEIDAEIERASAKFVEAPSQDAANYAAAIASRSNYTEAEARAALAKYTDHTTRMAISDAAKRSGLRLFITSPVEDELNRLQDLRDAASQMFTIYSIGKRDAATRITATKNIECIAQGIYGIDAANAVFGSMSQDGE